MYKSVILPLAKQDIKEAAEWYKTKHLGLDLRFIDEVRKRVQFLEKFPNAAPIRFDKIRALVLKEFPFMIHYSLHTPSKTIVIVGVFHTSQSPDSWRK